MTRRLCALVLVALVALAAGCGGGDSPKGDLGDSLGCLPKAAPLVLTVDTDVEGDQYKNLDKLLSKFPFGGQLKNQIKQSISQQGADYDKDVKPLLGGEVLVGWTDPASLKNDPAPNGIVFAFPADGGKLKDSLDHDNSVSEA